MNGTTQTSALSVSAKNVATALLATCCLAASVPAQVTLIPPSPVSTVSTVNALNADGSIAAGYSNGVTGGAPGFTWTQSTGRFDFGLQIAPGSSTIANALSGDGVVVAGRFSTTSTARTAYRWTGSNSIQLLGRQAGYTESEALATNGDGSVVVGQSYTEVGVQGIVASQAFRWTPAGGLQGLGFLRPGRDRSWATGVSADGNVIVGTNRSIGGNEAFTWTPSSGMTALPHLPGATYSLGLAVNTDGSIVLGISGNAVVQWRNGQVVDLGYPTGYGSGYFTALSGDGMVAGGRMRSPSGSDVPAIWTPATGMVPFTQYLLDREIQVPNGVTFTTLNAISGDGLTFGGTARVNNVPVGYVITVPTPASILPLGLLLACRRARPAFPACPPTVENHVAPS